MADEVIKSKQEALIDQYKALYDDYLADLNATQFQKARESQRALKVLEKDIYENTLSMPTSENSGFLDLKSKMEKVPTAEAQENYSKEKMESSKFQYFALLVIAAFMLLAAARILYFSSEPSKMEAIIFIVLNSALLFFLFKY